MVDKATTHSDGSVSWQRKSASDGPTLSPECSTCGQSTTGGVFGTGFSPGTLTAEQADEVFEAHSALMAVMNRLGIKWGDMVTVERQRVVDWLRARAVSEPSHAGNPVAMLERGTRTVALLEAAKSLEDGEL